MSELTSYSNWDRRRYVRKRERLCNLGSRVDATCCTSGFKCEYRLREFNKAGTIWGHGND
jgi:hypothetical protein